MTFSMWLLSAVSNLAILAAVGYFFRNSMADWLSRAIQHKYDRDLEKIRAELRQKETEMAALREGALSGLISRQIAVDKRRIEAVEQIWAGVISLGKARWTSEMMARLRFDEALKSAAESEHNRTVFKTMLGEFKPEELKNPAMLAKPFVTPNVWALWSAYSSVLLYAVAQAMALQTGLAKNILTHDTTNQLLIAALPDHELYIEKHGPAGYHWMLDTIEERLLSELNKMLEGHAADEATLTRSRTIIRSAEQLWSKDPSDVEVPEDFRADPVDPPA